MERAIAGALDSRIDPEQHLVKQPVLDEETHEAARAGADQIAVELSLESLNFLNDVTLDQRGVPLEWTAECRGSPPFGHGVQQIAPSVAAGH